MVLAHLYTNEIHVNRGYALLIAILLHTTNYLPKALFGILEITTVLIDVAHHIVGHIHLFVELAL